MLINEMTSRQAMNLPEWYESGLFEDMQKFFMALQHKNISQLVEMTASLQADLSERYAAATLLSLLGDIRIKPFDPEMILIPAAVAAIGSTMPEIEAAYHQYHTVGVLKPWLLKEYPQHDVHIPSFRISKYLITNLEYLTFLKDTKNKDIPKVWQLGMYDALKANHPVYGISAKNADQYAAWLSKKLNRVFRLPTEYEWEYAATGMSRNEFPWGKLFSSEKANTVESKIFSTTPIGIYPNGASPFGVLDMAGNVEEFVASSYFCYPGGQVVQDDLGGENEYRVARGGSFTRHADLVRCRRRHGAFDKDIYVIGFRLVEEI